MRTAYSFFVRYNPIALLVQALDNEIIINANLKLSHGVFIMAWKLEIHFSDGSSEVVDEDFETEQEAQDEYDSWLDNWNVGRETLMLAGEDYTDADIEDCDIWEE